MHRAVARCILDVARKVRRPAKLRNFDELGALMPFAYRAQNLARQQVDPSQQGQGTVPEVFMLSPYGRVLSWDRGQIRGRILDGLDVGLLVVAEHRDQIGWRGPRSRQISTSL